MQTKVTKDTTKRQGLTGFAICGRVFNAGLFVFFFFFGAKTMKHQISFNVIQHETYNGSMQKRVRQYNDTESAIEIEQNNNNEFLLHITTPREIIHCVFTKEQLLTLINQSLKLL